MINCLNCSSSRIVNSVRDAGETSAPLTLKNSHIHKGKQRFKCNECNRQFIKNSQKITINQEKIVATLPSPLG